MTKDSLFCSVHLDSALLDELAKHPEGMPIDFKIKF
jgi:hypothetical protein